MEGAAVPPAMGLQDELEARDQIIAVDSKIMFGMVMDAFGSKSVPEFTETNCGEDGVMVTVTIDVSCARCYFGTQKPQSAVIKGEPNNSKMLAERSAVLRAIGYLNDRHKVKIIDFSTKVVYGIEQSNAFGHVNASLYSLEKVVAQWEITMDECKELAIQLHAKYAASDGEEHSFQKWSLYGPLKEFMDDIVDMYSRKVTDAKAKASTLEFMRRKYHQRSTERSRQDLLKGSMQFVVVPPKGILDYVLECLGSGKAEYTNSPTSYGMTKGEVTFYLHPVEGSACSGNIKIKGKGRDSKGAEEDAAYKALLYIEENRKIRVHDIYHADRVDAEKEHKYLIRLLEQIIDEFGTVKRHWGKMVEKISKENKKYINHQASEYPAEGNDKKAEAYRFCAEQIEHLDKASTKRFEDSGERFEELRSLSCKLEQLKTEMELD